MSHDNSSGPSRRDDQLNEIILEYLRAVDAGEMPTPESWLAEFPQYAAELNEFFADQERFEQLAEPLGPPPGGDPTAEYRDPAAAEVTPAGSPGPSVEAGAEQRIGNYELLEEVGRGGMGVVYKARQMKLDRIVAVKMVQSSRLASEADLQRFRAEAKAAGKLRHPNIVAIHQVVEEGGQHFYSMDYIDGRSLAQAAHQGPLPADQAARYLKSIAEAVQYAHSNGILHRDLKPSNVIIDEDDDPRILDFGLAKNLADQSDLTRSGVALGTPGYMSPEQAQGRIAEIGPHSDVYSLGAILYELLTGRPPFRGRSHYDTLSRVLHDAPVPPTSVNPKASRALETICLKCLQKDPRRRYGSAQELADDLDRFLRQEPIQAKPAGLVLRTWYWIRGIPVVAVLTGRAVRAPTVGQRGAQRLILAIPLIVLAGLVARALWPETLPSTIRIAAGRPGGMYHPLGETFAPFLAKLADRPVDVLKTSGSLANAELLMSGEAEMALIQSSTFSSERLMIVTALYYEFVYVIVRRSAKIARMEDLRGKAVSLGPEGSGMRISARKLLGCYEVAEDGITRSDAYFTELLEDDSLQAAIVTVGAHESTDVERLLSDPRFALLPIPDAERVSLEKECFKAAHIPEEATAAGGSSSAERIPTVMTPAFLVVRGDSSDLLVTTALNALYLESDLVETYDLVSLEEASEWRSWGLHPAARRFFEAYRPEAR